jgi:hypothetical protein
MKCTVKGNKQIRSHNTSYCLIEVVTKAGLTVLMKMENFNLSKSKNIIKSTKKDRMKF